MKATRVFLISLALLLLVSCTPASNSAVQSSSIQAQIDAAVASALASAGVVTTTSTAISSVAASTAASAGDPAPSSISLSRGDSAALYVGATDISLKVTVSPESSPTSGIYFLCSPDDCIEIMPSVAFAGEALYFAKLLKAGTVTVQAFSSDGSVSSPPLRLTIQDPSKNTTTAMSFSAYASLCTNYTYKELARDPSKYEGKYTHVKGEVIQVLEEDDDVTLRVNITKDDYFWTDTILVFYQRKSSTESRILEDDIVDIYGIFGGMFTYETVLGGSATVPLVFAQYLILDD